jgi:hypothetical protein
MTMSHASRTPDTPLLRGVLVIARPNLGGRRVLLLPAVAGPPAAVALDWSLLITTGVGPVLLAALPCLVMCGSGPCVIRLISGFCESHSPSTPLSEPKADVSDYKSTRTVAIGSLSCGDRAINDNENSSHL